jgi:hypothetical protein
VYGYIARDDASREFIVAFRGAPDGKITSTINSNKTLVTLTGRYIQKWTDFFQPRVHGGFLAMYESVGKVILDTITAETKKNPNKYNEYRIISVGHNVGGALAMINSVNLQYMDASRNSGRYSQPTTFGTPRVGNADWAALCSQLIGTWRGQCRAPGLAGARGSFPLSSCPHQ